MRVQSYMLITVIAVILVGCGSDSMPYKSLADTRPSTPTGNVVGVQKEVVKISEPVVAETEVEESISNAPVCRDSDYGNMPESAGIVRGIDEYGAEYENSDACIGDTIYEYYCDGDNAKVVRDKCSRGCKNGFCV